VDARLERTVRLGRGNGPVKLFAADAADRVDQVMVVRLDTIGDAASPSQFSGNIEERCGLPTLVGFAIAGVAYPATISSRGPSMMK
jgi:hypothetical protein